MQTQTQMEFRIGQTVSWQDETGLHCGRIVSQSQNGAAAFVSDVVTHQGHRVGVDRLTLVEAETDRMSHTPARLVELPLTVDLPLALIAPSRWQPRAQHFDETALLDLATSIQEMGLITPVTVFDVRNVAVPLPETDRPYELVAGERRTRACIALALHRAYGHKGLDEWCSRLAHVGLQGLGHEEREALSTMVGATIRATVELPDMRRLHKIAVMENIEREALSPIEEARAFASLMSDYGWSQRQLAKEVGKSQGYIAQRLALVDLPELAQQAVDAGAITPTHARAIAGVPVALQETVTAHVVEAVTADESPATTREVEELTRALTRFVDPARWFVPEDLVVLSRTRNNVALIRWALEHADLSTCGPALIELGTSTLTPAGYRIGADDFRTNRVLRALTGGQELQTLWPRFAAETGRRCETCQLYAHPVDLAGLVFSSCPCIRWRMDEAAVDVCPGWSGPDHPAIVDVGWPVDTWMHEHDMGAEIRTTDGLHWREVTDLDSYLVALQGVLADRQAQSDATTPREPSHVGKIRAYWEWQQGLPAEDLAHAQAHACHKCRQYQPLQAEEGLPPCWFAKARGSHVPQFGALVNKAGHMLPRCDMFQVRELPALALDAYPEDTALPASAVATWLESVGSHGYSSWCAVWSSLAWLPYDRASEKADWGKLKAWLRQNWDAIGGDRGMALLLDVAASESAWREHVGYSGQKPRKLLNPQTGQREAWMGLSEHELARRQVRDWPAGWVDPFAAPEAQPDAETPQL